MAGAAYQCLGDASVCFSYATIGYRAENPWPLRREFLKKNLQRQAPLGLRTSRCGKIDSKNQKPVYTR
jgi:hypothetical protein